MKTNIKGTNIELNPSIHDYLEKRLKVVGKLIDVNDPTLHIDVELAKTTQHHQNGDFFKAEINLFIDGKTFRAVAEEADLYSAIDIMQEQIAQELRSYKGKKLSLVRRGGQKVKDLLRGVYNKYRN